jgi:hypothetical protein
MYDFSAVFRDYLLSLSERTTKVKCHDEKEVSVNLYFNLLDFRMIRSGKTIG